MKWNYRVRKSLVVWTALTLLLAGCASQPENQSLQADAIPFLPTTDLPIGLGQNPSPVTSDVEQLKSSYAIFKVEEEAVDDATDYYLEWDDTFENDLGGRFLNPESTRLRDGATLTIGPPSLVVYREDSDSGLAGMVQILWSLTFKTGDPSESQLFGIAALCNGILVEVKGEGFEVPSNQACPSKIYTDFGVDTAPFSIVGDLDLEDRRMLMLMSQNPFVIKVVGDDGKARAFEFNGAKRPISDWTPQDYIRIGLEAEQAVLAGFGY